MRTALERIIQEIIRKFNTAILPRYHNPVSQILNADKVLEFSLFYVLWTGKYFTVTRKLKLLVNIAIDHMIKNDDSGLVTDLQDHQSVNIDMRVSCIHTFARVAYFKSVNILLL